MHAQAPRIHERRIQLIHARAPNQPHIHLHLILQQLHRAIHARQSVRTHGEQERPSEPHARGSEAESFNDICGPTNAAVDVDFDAVLPAPFAEHGHDFGQDFDAGAREVELAAAVVGEDDAVHADFDGADDVFDALDAFEDDGHFRDAEEPGDVFPA